MVNINMTKFPGSEEWQKFRAECGKKNPDYRNIPQPYLGCLLVIGIPLYLTAMFFAALYYFLIIRVFYSKEKIDAFHERANKWHKDKYGF